MKILRYIFEVKGTSTIQELIYGSDTFFFVPGSFTLIFPCAFTMKKWFCFASKS